MCYSSACVFYTMHSVYPICIRYSHLYRTCTVCICHIYTVFTIHAWLYHMHIANSAILDALDPSMSPFTESTLTYTYIHGPMVLCFCIYTVATYIRSSYACHVSADRDGTVTFYKLRITITCVCISKSNSLQLHITHKIK